MYQIFIYCEQKVSNFWTKFTQKKIFLEEKRKSEEPPGRLHVPISLGTKYQLIQTILIFWTKFAHKGFWGSKTQKVNITTDFEYSNQSTMF